MKPFNYRARSNRALRDLQAVIDSLKTNGAAANYRAWFTPILESFIKHNYLEISERRCLNYLPGHEPALPAASLPVISSPADISLPTAATESQAGGEGVQPAPLSGGADQSMPISTNPQSVTQTSQGYTISDAEAIPEEFKEAMRDIEGGRTVPLDTALNAPYRPEVGAVLMGGHLEGSEAVSSVSVGDSYPGTLSETKAVLVAEEWPKEAKVRVYGVCGNMRLMCGELEDGRRVSFWKGVRNWRINDWVPCRLDRGGGTPVYLPV